MLGTTLFRDVCGDSRLLLSTVISLQCEVSTEALISDLELTLVSIDQFTVETTYPFGWFALLGSVCREFKSCFNGSIKNVVPSSGIL